MTPNPPVAAGDVRRQYPPSTQACTIVCRGVRPSSGAATSDYPDATKLSKAYLLFPVAATRDGRTSPLS
jgi:hypothetical protein